MTFARVDLLANDMFSFRRASPEAAPGGRAGVYNEEVFASLDWVLDQAAQRKIRIIIPFEVRAWPLRPQALGCLPAGCNAARKHVVPARRACTA